MGSKKGVPHRKWNKEEKLEIIHLHLEEHKPLKQIEREYSVSSGLVSNWIKRYMEEGERGLESRCGNPYAALHSSKTLSEVERLRLLVAKQEIEIARLKKGLKVRKFFNCAPLCCKFPLLQNDIPAQHRDIFPYPLCLKTYPWGVSIANNHRRAYDRLQTLHLFPNALPHLPQNISPL